MTSASEPLSRNYKSTRNVDGIALSLEVSPCSWMYPRYGLQVMVSMPSGGRATILNKTLAFEDAQEHDAERLFQSVRLCACTRCGAPAFDASTVNTNRGDSCESCFVQDLTRKFEAELQAEEDALRQQDATHRASGHKFRISAYIHPANGDDIQMHFWTKTRWTDEQIKDRLKQEGSMITDDFHVTAI